ncbi:hypothetical protein Pedsa_0346 [Pseudopedobacter saltans DSM 12145]|uniref:DUF4835 domain-containing protein n=1 Tax=Pseudopedobacter saltans (strain ATCC 51119 / DSM 12145 / JCM 21818 / CCUG 39354 / LMG 10337 / NBRC 100064 / NCIMB 13643) TaxID=762903 RepID=F0S511_PSESL|nr:DUF4835 family protein [Pseudopedobacter saltans]ADY50928.1 hypothetical protein Pedsa_0346 [Pseudopedobacter saltans DSM 12145]
MRYCLSLILSFFTVVNIQAQDLNARVQILTPQIQNTNKRPIEILEQTITDFLNNRKWSNDQIKANERIDCSFVLNIKEWDGSSNFKAEAQIISTRPVFNSSYNSTSLSISDKSFDFNFSEGQPFDYSEQNYINNLTSLLAFYAYIIVGLDYDSFSKLGGSAYYTKAQTVLNNAQSSGYAGWQAHENLKNRYWLVENLLSKSFHPLREFIYAYHREGLDMMSDNLSKGRKNILDVLPKLEEIDRQKQGAIFMQTFFTAKADELANVFSKADPTEKMKVYNLLSGIDPSNIRKYDILKKR